MVQCQFGCFITRDLWPMVLWCWMRLSDLMHVNNRRLHGSDCRQVWSSFDERGPLPLRWPRLSHSQECDQGAGKVLFGAGNKMLNGVGRIPIFGCTGHWWIDELSVWSEDDMQHRWYTVYCYCIRVFFLGALEASSDRQLKSMTVCWGSRPGTHGKRLNTGSKRI